MEKEHICKFCSKSFPCGRSLGSHMRSHLINTPPLGHPKNVKRRPPKKKLPPLTMDQSCHEKHKACKECGKSFPSWKALFGHMKCHSPNNGGMLVTDSQSDNEVGTTTTTPPSKRKRSDRTITTRYNNTSITNSSTSLTIVKPEIDENNDDDDDDDQHDEQEEVALSLIILSRDKSYWGAMEGKNSKLDPKSIGVESLQKLKKLKSPRVEAKTRKLESLNNEIEVGFDEFEVNSPKNLITRSHHDQFGRERKASREGNSSSKFRCSICKKAFRSYQALGGHRASHKKFKGCCAPKSSQDSLETEDSHSQKSKEHECPLCFKVFPSGQALGGHKRSHLIADQAKASPPHQTVEIRGFLDLNLPPPAEEEECGEFKPWWIEGAARLGLLSTS